MLCVIHIFITTTNIITIINKKKICFIVFIYSNKFVFLINKIINKIQPPKSKDHKKIGNNSITDFFSLSLLLLRSLLILLLFLLILILLLLLLLYLILLPLLLFLLILLLSSSSSSSYSSTSSSSSSSSSVLCSSSVSSTVPVATREKSISFKCRRTKAATESSRFSCPCT